MGVMREDIERAGAVSVPASDALAAGSAGRGSDPRSELRVRRDVLAAQVTELHWDLGGLAYEMAIRDHFRLDVLVRRAATLQERDGELAEIERLLRIGDESPAGHCPSCAAPHSRDARFCWQCGATLMARLPSETADGGEAAADVLGTLLNSDGPHGAESPIRADL